MLTCPRCNSENIKTQMYAGLDCIICRDCGFDERILQDQPNQKTSQRAKGAYSVYRKGGAARSKKY